MSSYEVVCPHCGKSLMARDSAGVTHLLTRKTTFRPDGTVTGKCPQCKHEVPVPVRLAPTMAHIITKTPRQ